MIETAGAWSALSRIDPAMASAAPHMTPSRLRLRDWGTVGCVFDRNQRPIRRQQRKVLLEPLLVQGLHELHESAAVVLVAG